ncbi:MAG: hypothetical protein ACFFDN_08165, partial [Candidatus Hodarchaeota archaeon]
IDTKTRLVTSDFDFLLLGDGFSKLLNELKNKSEIEISTTSIIDNIETDPFGWISFNLHLKKLNYSTLIEFININSFEKKYRNKLVSIIERNKKYLKVKDTLIYYLPVEIIFAMRLAITDWKTYIHKINAHITELKVYGVTISREKFKDIIKKLDLEDRASLIKFD